MDLLSISLKACLGTMLLKQSVTCFAFAGHNYYRMRQTPHFHGPQPLHDDNAAKDVSCSSQETGTSERYENLTSDGDPIPALSRGVVSYKRDYMNTRPGRNSRYDRLQLIQPLAMDWLRNAWGNVDQFGRHIYDVMQRIRHVFIPYNKLSYQIPVDSTEREVETDNDSYNTTERSPGVTLPVRLSADSTSKAENV